MIKQKGLLPYKPDRDPYWDTQHLKGMEVSGDRHCPESYHGSMFYAAENTKPQWVWERHFLLEFTLGCLTMMGELSPPKWGGTTQSLMGSLCPTASWTCTNTLYMKWNAHTENKEKVGVLIWHIHIYLLTTDSAVSPGQHKYYAQPGQVSKAANGPLPKIRWAHSVSHWYDHLDAIFVPSIGLKDILTQREALTKFAQQTLHNSLQSFLYWNL